MSYPFLEDSENKELIARILRARKPEDDRHQAKRNDIHADFLARNLIQSTVYITAMMAEEIEHVRKLFAIQVSELFLIVEQKELVLEDEDLDIVKKTLSDALANRATLLAEDLGAKSNALGPIVKGQMSASALPALGQVEEYIRGEVTIRASELNRKKKMDKKRAASKWKEKLGFIILGFLLAILATIIKGCIG